MVSETGRRPVLRFDDGGWAERVGNHVALDLVNTVAWRLDADRTVDRLPDDAALVRWVRFVGLVDEARAASLAAEVATDPELGSAVTAEVRALRELLYRVLQPIAAGGAPSARDVATLRRRLLGTLATAEVAEVMPMRWEAPAQTMRDVPVLVGLAAWQLLRHEDPSRLHQCRDATCGWLFLDRTKNASRVWCSSADCGNRARARRHYQRARSAG